MSIQVSYQPPNPAPGDKVTFTVRTNDPDASINPNGSCRDYTLYGDEPGGTVPGGCGPCPSTGRYGPWTPPAKSSGSRVDYPFHAYPKEGDFTATFRRASGDPCPDQTDPYASEATQLVSVTVRVRP
jgi:hypothetical protein